MSDTPVVGRITFDPQPDIVGLARIKIDGRFYGMPAWVVEHLAAMTKDRDEWKAKAEANERDAERWKDVLEFNGSYQISSKGRVRSINRIDTDGNTRVGRILHPTAIRKGYLKVCLWSANRRIEKYVHRLVAEAFIGNPDLLPQVNHKDGDPANNEECNLEWVTNAQNAIHARRVLARGVRAVFGVDGDGNRIDFPSLQHAVEAGFIRANIQKCIAGTRTMHRGYKWFDAARSAEKEK